MMTREHAHPLFYTGLCVLVISLCIVLHGASADPVNTNNSQFFVQYDTIGSSASGGATPIFQLLQNTLPGKEPIKNASIPEFVDTIKNTYSEKPAEFELILNPGWNFISTPAQLQSGRNSFSIFDRVNTMGHSLYGYKAKQWYKIRASDILSPDDGVWIYSVKTETIPLYFENTRSDSETGKVLHQGWNAIGVSSLFPVTASDALSSVSDTWSLLYSFNATTQRSDNPVIKGWKDQYSEQYHMVPGKGYWILMGDEGYLTRQNTLSSSEVTGTVDYQTITDDGWKFSIPGTVKGSFSADTGLITIESSDAFLTYGGKKYPLMMNIQAQLD